MTNYVKVTNNNEFVMGDRYNNDVYSFLPGQPVIIPIQAAWHFFKWPSQDENMKEHTSRRFGWDRENHVGADRNKGVSEELLVDSKLLVDLYWENLDFEVFNG